MPPVVIGGGLVGMEAAEYLAESGSRVTVLEMLPEVCADIGPVRKICVMEEIAKTWNCQQSQISR